MKRNQRPGVLVKENFKTTKYLRRWPTIGAFFGLLGLAALGNSSAFAQSEIDPDHFDSPNTEPFPQPKVAGREVRIIRYEGDFSLPYTAHCSGRKLAPGKYSVSLHSDGKVGQVTLHQKGQTVGTVIVGHMEISKQGNDGDVVIVKNSGKSRTLSVIHVADADFVFDLNYPIATSSNAGSARTEKLPLAMKAPRKSRTAGDP